jgi:hypothetical protein
MRTLADESAEYSRVVERDGSVRPFIDTGFRMGPTEPDPYMPRPNPPTMRLYDHVHADDIATREESRGLRGVFYITVDSDAVEDRMLQDISCNIIESRKARDGNV